MMSELSRIVANTKKKNTKFLLLFLFLQKKNEIEGQRKIKKEEVEEKLVIKKMEGGERERET